MASNLFGRYVWLIDTLRREGKLTFEEINNRWKKSGLNYGEGYDLALRTFHNHRAAIFDIFGIDISCDTKDGYRYYLSNPEDLEGDSLRSWLLDSYSLLNQVQADNKLERRIIFENVPSGRKWLTAITRAIRLSNVIEITYQRFDSAVPKVHQVEPYYLKVNKQRWYLIARKEEKFLTFALDRIQDVKQLDKTFSFNDDFDIDEYFKGCCGIMPAEEEPIRVVIKAVEDCPYFLRTLPLHESQVELPSDDTEVAYFEYHVCPNFEFYQTLFSQIDLIEVIEPESVRHKMQTFAKSFSDMYQSRDNISDEAM